MASTAGAGTEGREPGFGLQWWLVSRVTGQAGVGDAEAGVCQDEAQRGITQRPAAAGTPLGEVFRGDVFTALRFVPREAIVEFECEGGE